MENIIIVGSSGHAKVIIDIIEKEGKYKIIGLLDAFKKPGMVSFGYQIIGKEENLPTLIKKYSVIGGIIAIGDNWVRNQVCQKIRIIIPDFFFIRAIHPSAILARNVNIGQGTVLMAGVIVNSDTQIGDFCILNTNSSIDHDSKMEDFSSLAPNSTAGGNVSIGAFSAISLGANIIHKISIGEHTVIGAGATVLKDIDSYSVAYGTPARVIRKRNKDDKYL